MEANRPLSFWKKRSRSTYVTATFSIALVLVFVGVFGGIIFFGQEVADRLRNRLEMKVFLHDAVGQIQQNEFELTLRNHPAISLITFVSKEEAAEIMLRRTGEDVLEMMGGVNPLPASYNLRIERAYQEGEKLDELRGEIGAYRIVSEVVFQGERLKRLEENLQTIGWATAGIGLVLLAVAFYLITATIRLSIYARRLTIRSMELVGATRRFILRPFLIRGLLQGGIAGILASGLLTLLLSWTQQWLVKADLPVASLPPSDAYTLLAGIILLGLLLGWVGSYFAVSRYLNRRLDELM